MKRLVILFLALTACLFAATPPPPTPNAYARGIPLFGETKPNSRILAISLTCPHCIELLSQLVAEPMPKDGIPPTVVFRADDPLAIDFISTWMAYKGVNAQDRVGLGIEILRKGYEAGLPAEVVSAMLRNSTPKTPTFVLDAKQAVDAHQRMWSEINFMGFPSLYVLNDREPKKISGPKDIWGNTNLVNLRTSIP